MFFHNFKYTLKTLLKNRMLIFWTFAFPIILGTFFNMAFANIENSEAFKAIDIAIVNNENFNENDIFKKSFEMLSDETSDNQVFNTEYVSEEEAKGLLENGDIVGYLILNETPKVVVTSSGTSETILKYVTEEIMQTTDIVNNVAESEIKAAYQKNNGNIDYEKIYLDVFQKTQMIVAEFDDISNDNLSYTMIEFYTLIAMSCLYGGTIGMVAINKNLANMSNNGKRVSVSPISKRNLIFSSALASYLIELVGIALLFFYTIFALNVDYGNNLWHVILLAIVGCFAGLSLGVAVASVFKTNDNTKIGIIISISMVCSFLSGMMGITMKYVIDKNIPIINNLNPVAMITDGFYSLYYYDTSSRFYFNVISLLIFSLVLIGISVLSLRRQKYDSI